MHSGRCRGAKARTQILPDPAVVRSSLCRAVPFTYQSYHSPGAAATAGPAGDPQNIFGGREKLKSRKTYTGALCQLAHYSPHESACLFPSEETGHSLVAETPDLLSSFSHPTTDPCDPELTDHVFFSCFSFFSLASLFFSLFVVVFEHMYLPLPTAEQPSQDCFSTTPPT